MDHVASSRDALGLVVTPAPGEIGPPRFEFRVWGQQVASAARRLRSRSAPVAVRESVETYFIASGAVDVNPKARVDLFDVKVLIGVRERCEQWAVHRKEPFPVPAAVVASELLGALRVEQPELVRSSYELDQLVEEVVGPHSDVMAVEVDKRRELYSLDRVMAEVSAVAFADRTFETLAVEAPVLGDVTELRAELGLESAENVSYPRLLRATLGGRFATAG